MLRVLILVVGGGNEEFEDQYSTEECSEEEGESTEEGEDEGESAEEECKQEQQKNAVKAKRGLTRLPKLRTRFTNSGGKRHEVEFDSLGRLTGEYRSEFTSFLGDTVREHVGLRWLTWKEVPKEVKAKLWDQITVNQLLRIKYSKYMLHFQYETLLFNLSACLLCVLTPCIIYCSIFLI